MKQLIRWTLSILIIVFVIAILTCPSKKDYLEWLSDKYNISCTSTPEVIVCQENSKNIEIHSRHIRTAGMYMKVEDIYSRSNTQYEIKVIGLFNIFIDYSRIIIRD